MIAFGTGLTLLSKQSQTSISAPLVSEGETIPNYNSGHQHERLRKEIETGRVNSNGNRGGDLELTGRNPLLPCDKVRPFVRCPSGGARSHIALFCASRRKGSCQQAYISMGTLV
jgi:hypothetical protein